MVKVGLGEAHLIGNGYSLTAPFLDTLTNKVTFAMNGIAKIFPFTAWRPMFYIMVSTRYHNDDPEFQEAVHLAVRASHRAFISSYCEDVPFFREQKNVCFINANEDLTWYSKGIFSKYATSMLTAIQLASFMGYDPLILHGVDGYRRFGRNHFTSDYYKGERPAIEQNETMQCAYIFARENCPSKIYDATLGSGMNVFERVKDA